VQRKRWIGTELAVDWKGSKMGSRAIFPKTAGATWGLSGEQRKAPFFGGNFRGFGGKFHPNTLRGVLAPPNSGESVHGRPGVDSSSFSPQASLAVSTKLACQKRAGSTKPFWCHPSLMAARTVPTGSHMVAPGPLPPRPSQVL